MKKLIFALAVSLVVLLMAVPAYAESAYVVQPGDTLYRISLRFGVSPEAILAANGLANPNLIFVGQRLVIPDAGAALTVSTATPTPAASTVVPQPAASSNTYKVKRGDTLWAISRRNGTTVAAMMAANGMTSPIIYIGQVLIIPGRATATPVATPTAVGASPASAPAGSGVYMSRGIRGDYFTLDTNRIGVGQKIWFDFKVTATGGDQDFGLLSVHSDYGINGLSWSNSTLRGGQSLEWHDHLQIGTPGTYPFYIGTRLTLVETADDITNTILEVRRYEKNFLLYKDGTSLGELRQYLAILKKNIDHIETEIIFELGSGNYETMKRAIAEYERLIETIAANLQSQEEQAALVRSAGRKAEQSLGKSELQSFLVLRRWEKNIMLYRSKDAYAVFRKTLDASALGERREIRHYTMLVTQLFRLYESERGSEESMRVTAREIQSFTQNLSKQERSDIATTIKMSVSLLLIALVLIATLGTVTTIKLATSIATPIRTLEKITKKIAQGDFSERIEVKGQDELSSLEASFNLMEEKLKNAQWSLEHTIEKLREKQAQLVEAEKLASVGKLAAGIAHEINNPLTSVLTFSNLMLEQCPPADPRHEKLKLMVRETDRARNIVRQLLNFGRETVIKPVKININQPVSEIADSLVAQDAFKGIELSQKLGDNLPEVNADPAQIGQVVLNILLNAIHSITPPGRIEVATRLCEKNVEITFSDTGAGIPEEHIRKIFDPFFTTKDAFKGTGLGLAVSYGIIKKHGGDIEVASAVGQGTTFTVRLPIYGQV